MSVYFDPYSMFARRVTTVIVVIIAAIVFFISENEILAVIVGISLMVANEILLYRFRSKAVSSDPYPTLAAFQEIKSDIISDLSRILNKTISPDEFRAKLRKYPREVQEALGEIEHYLSNGDIRRRDSEYANMQDQELAKLISLIEQNAFSGELKKITFLKQT